MEAVTMAKAINLSLRDALARDDNVLIFGEDVGALGGVFRITDGLQKASARARVRYPLGSRPSSGLRRPGASAVSSPCGDPVRRIHLPGVRADRQHVAKYHNRSGVPLPITIRLPFAVNIGAVEPTPKVPRRTRPTAGLKSVTATAITVLPPTTSCR